MEEGYSQVDAQIIRSLKTKLVANVGSHIG